jgi:hypothetical protein
MYKNFKVGRGAITFHCFPKTAKKVSEVYLSGIRSWEDDDSYNYSLVFYTFRIFISIFKNVSTTAKQKGGGDGGRESINSND